MTLYNHLLQESRYLSRYQLISESSYSKSQFYSWLNNGIRERKVREPKSISEAAVKNAVLVIRKYPHFSASKGQCYMIYYRLGYIPHHIYKLIKERVKRLIFREVGHRRLLPAERSYEHQRPGGLGQIWAEDFTEVRVCGEKFYVALVVDVAKCYYLGAVSSRSANAEMVEEAILQALAFTGGVGPLLFLISDNGPQYIETGHGEFLEHLSIVQKRIPSCKPQYNGSVECGIKEFKNVFYNVWAEMEKNGVDKEKTLSERVQLAVTETTTRMNNEIPRPSLNGVTASDEWEGVADKRREMNRIYLEQEREREVSGPWNRDDWKIIAQSLFGDKMDDLELLTKFCFFLKRPLRKIVKLIPEVLGN